MGHGRLQKRQRDPRGRSEGWARGAGPGLAWPCLQRRRSGAQHLFSAVALGIVCALIGGVGLAAYLVYPLGFLIVIFGRAQLFTENTVTPVTAALTDPRAICKEAEPPCEHSSNTKL